MRACVCVTHSSPAGSSLEGRPSLSLKKNGIPKKKKWTSGAGDESEGTEEDVGE